MSTHIQGVRATLMVTKFIYCLARATAPTADGLDPTISGNVIKTTHKWTVKGSYSIKVKAKEIYGKESVWSDPLPITMPYTYNPILQFLELLFQRFPHAFPILRSLLGY